MTEAEVTQTLQKMLFCQLIVFICLIGYIVISIIETVQTRKRTIAEEAEVQITIGDKLLTGTTTINRSPAGYQVGEKSYLVANRPIELEVQEAPQLAEPIGFKRFHEKSQS